MRISLEQFTKVGLTVGKAVSVAENSQARIPAYLIQLDFGPSLSDEHKTVSKKTTYTSSAQLCSQHRVEDILNRLMMCVYNFPRKQIGKMMSDCLVTGVQKVLPSAEDKRATTVFMTPSCEVPLGSKVGLLADEAVYHSNPRNLEWAEFSLVDLRIGTIVSSTLASEEAREADDDMPALKHMQIDLGADGVQDAVGFFRPELASQELSGQQVMVLTNLSSTDIQAYFEGSTATAAICTVAGRALLQPAKPVENGYKLA